MKSWDSRPREVAALLNPAFCAIFIREAAAGHRSRGRRGLPFAVAAIVLPIGLHEPTRHKLPTTTRKRLIDWVRENPAVRIGFGVRARSLLPYFREAVLLGAREGLIQVGSDGELRLSGRLRPNVEIDSELQAQLETANFLGRWLADVSDTKTLFAVWGIRP